MVATEPESVLAKNMIFIELFPMPRRLKSEQ